MEEEMKHEEEGNEAEKKNEEDRKEAEKKNEEDIKEAEKKKGVDRKKAEKKKEEDIKEAEKKKAGDRKKAEKTKEEDKKEVEKKKEEDRKKEEKKKEEEMKEAEKKEEERKKEEKEGGRVKRETKRSATLVSPYTGESKKEPKRRKTVATKGGDKKINIKKCTAETSDPYATAENKDNEVTETSRIPLPHDPTKVFDAKIRYEMIRQWVSKNLKQKRGKVAGLRTVVKTVDPISCRCLGILFSATGWLSSEV